MSPQIGQLLLIGIEGYELSPIEKELIKSTVPTGIILFKRNCQTYKQIFDLNKSIYSSFGNDDNPDPFISVDQEGGRVQRLPKDEFANYPSFREVAKLNNPEVAEKLYSYLARDLRSAGFNLNFSPVLDLDTNPDNPIIGDRSFGDSVSSVVEHAKIVTKAFASEGIISCGKHFPGHGDTDLDSHLALPTLNLSKELMVNRELAPFREMAKDGLDVIMSAHIIYPEFDHLPATLSSKTLPKLLDFIGFKGIVFSDDLEMKAIADNFSLRETISMGLEAGINIFSICKDINLWREAHEILLSLYQQEPYKQLIDSSLAKIKDFKKNKLTSSSFSMFSAEIDDQTLSSRELIKKWFS